MLSTKNSGLAAAGDLGLGDQLQSQVETEIDERRKKLLRQAGMMSAMAPQTMGTAANSLFNLGGMPGG
jgi:hypothetical protein